MTAEPQVGVDAQWVAQLDRTLTNVSRALRSPMLHEMVGRRAGIAMGEHLHLTLAHISSAEPVRVRELAAALDLEQSTTSRRVTRLVEDGLVERLVDPDDRRAAAHRLTPAGRASLAAIQQSWLGLLAELSSTWSASRREQTLRRLLELDDQLRPLLTAT